MTARVVRAGAGLALGVMLAAPRASAAEPFVDRPLTLSPARGSLDVGVGFGSWQDIEPDPTNPENTIVTGTKFGFGSSLEAHVGLPWLGELGARVGYRFDSVAIASQADHFARLFDPVVNEPGADAFTNPELALRKTVFGVPSFEFAIEGRAILPTAASSDFGLTLGTPVRVHLRDRVRIDTGVYVPIAFSDPATVGVQVPAQFFFQVGDTFVGPLTGLLFVQNGGDPNPRLMAGLGVGHTFGGILDLKAQVYTSQINDVNWSKHVGAGLGVGVLL